MKKKKNNNKIYISLPISGYDIEERKEKAMQADVKLRGLGYDTFNPLGEQWEEDLSYQEYMKIALRGLMECDTIYLLNGWHLSNGCNVELRVATAIGLDVWFEDIEIVKL